MDEKVRLNPKEFDILGRARPTFVLKTHVTSMPNCYPAVKKMVVCRLIRTSTTVSNYSAYAPMTWLKQGCLERDLLISILTIWLWGMERDCEMFVVCKLKQNKTKLVAQKIVPLYKSCK